MIFLFILGLMGSNNQGKLIFREDKRLKMAETLTSHTNRRDYYAARKELRKTRQR